MDYDKYGHCVSCHKFMVVEKNINGKMIRMFTPEKTSLQVMLNDSSRMRVAMCVECKKNTKESDLPDVMASVYRGWQEEVKFLVDSKKDNHKQWTREVGNKYLARQKLLEIVTVSENKSERKLNESVIKFKKGKK